MIRGIGRVEGQISVATPLEHLLHEPAASTLSLGSRGCDHQANGRELAAIWEPHRAAEDASNTIDCYDAMTCAA